MSSCPPVQGITGTGTARFKTAADYQAALQHVILNLTVTGGGDFKARLSWSTLRSVRVVRAYENVARIAYTAPPPGRVCFVFSKGAAGATWRGRKLGAGEIFFRAGDEKAHHWTAGESQWGLVSTTPEALGACSRALTGVDVAVAPGGRVLRPARSVSMRLLRLHAKVCGLAETEPELLRLPEVARALEQEILQTLIECVSSGSNKSEREYPAIRRHAQIMDKFEDALAVDVGNRLHMPELCAAMRIPERTLRVCCAEFVGMSPTRYHLLRRLNSARAALQRSDPECAGVADIARGCGFGELGRFAAVYRAVFGELPSTTWRHAR